MYSKFVDKLKLLGSPHLLVPLFPCLLVSLSLFTSCAGHSPGQEQTIPQVLARVQSCAPTTESDSNLKFAVVGVTLLPDETDVRIVAHAGPETIDFDLPTYSLSRGRWLINGKGRAYLLDEKCREYKLKDRRSVNGQTIPLNGRIKLNPGETFEAILVFPSFLEPTRVGMLVYGGRSLSLTLREAENGAVTGAGTKAQ